MIMSTIASWLLLSVAVYVTALILPGFRVTGFKGALWVAALFGILNWALGWLLFNVFGIVSLGLGYLLAFVTAWLVNTILLALTDKLTRSLDIRSFGWAALGAGCIAVLSTLGHYLASAAASAA